MKEYSSVNHRDNTAKRHEQVISMFIGRVGPGKPPRIVTRKNVLDFQRDRTSEVAPDTVNGDSAGG